MNIKPISVLDPSTWLDKYGKDKKGGFRRIDEPIEKGKGECSNMIPEHLPPTNIVLPSGTYEYTCPRCGHITIVRATKPTL